MKLDAIKEDIRALSPKDRGALMRFLRCLDVVEDPGWQSIVREAAERRIVAEKAMRATKAAARKGGAKAA